MARVFYRRGALEDIDNACDFSERKWGAAQRSRYEEIIAEAAAELASNPLIGRPRPELDPAARSLFIRRPGKNASHILYYFVGDDGDVHVVRMLHAAQDPVLNLAEESWR
jgi:toxin ParE1/3/4